MNACRALGLVWLLLLIVEIVLHLIKRMSAVYQEATSLVQAGLCCILCGKLIVCCGSIDHWCVGMILKTPGEAHLSTNVCL